MHNEIDIFFDNLDNEITRWHNRRDKDTANRLYIMLSAVEAIITKDEWSTLEQLVKVYHEVREYLGKDNQTANV